jgi:glycosyltransferase involved in cell wall biosynthesis
MDGGGKIRTGQLLKHLREVFDITLVSNIDRPKDDRYLPEMHRLCNVFHGVPRKYVPKYSLAFYLMVLARATSRYPVTVVNDYSPRLRAKLQELLQSERYDLLVCDFVQPSLNVPGRNGCRTLLFQHNVESVILRRCYETATNPVLRLFWWRQWKKMVWYEGLACRRFDGVVAVSDVDKAIIEQKFGAQKVFSIPTGVDTEFFRSGRQAIEENTLIFTGQMDWLPNEDAIVFFAENILDRLRALVPTVRLTVVGRNPSRKLLEKMKRYPEIRVIGRVEDIRPLVQCHAVYVIPLRIGGGTRIKAYEAMAMGKAVVSTRVGIEGLPVSDGQQLIVADRPDEFASAVSRLLKDDAERRRLGDRARQYVERHASWERAASVFARACETIARG